MIIPCEFNNLATHSSLDCFMIFIYMSQRNILKHLKCGITVHEIWMCNKNLLSLGKNVRLECCSQLLILVYKTTNQRRLWIPNRRALRWGSALSKDDQALKHSLPCQTYMCTCQILHITVTKWACVFYIFSCLLNNLTWTYDRMISSDLRDRDIEYHSVSIHKTYKDIPYFYQVWYMKIHLFHKKTVCFINDFFQNYLEVSFSSCIWIIIQPINMYFH